MDKTKRFKVNLIVSIPDVGYIPVTPGAVEQMMLKAFYAYITKFNKSRIEEVEAREVKG